MTGMRQLLYVPIIHDEADMGSAGAALAQKSAALSGDRRWALHKETVEKFWESIRAFLLSFDARRLRVYQDGLAADGEIGMRIVEEAARRGSKSYQLVLDMINRGAELRKTEDLVLLLKEHENIVRHMEQEMAGDQPLSAKEYRLERNRLMEERDKFIAEAINATLKEAELGVLFIGAYHKVAPLLAGDISLEVLKDRQKVEAYFEELLSGQEDKRFEELAKYLSSPVSVP